MFRHLTPCGLFLIGLVGTSSADGPAPPAHAITAPDALIRTAPPELKATGRHIPYGTRVVVVEEKSVGGKDYVRVHLGGDPKTELGWTAKSNLGSAREFDPAMKPEDAVDAAGLTGTKAVMAALYNARGKYLHEQAKALGVSPAALAAVLKVESGGRAFGPDGRVIVRFENHVFRRQWGDANQMRFDQHFKFSADKAWTEHYWRKAPTDPWVKCHTSQAGEWEVFEFAKTLSEPAALASASYGVGQIMGFNHKAVGHPTAAKMVGAFGEGIKPQLDAMVAFIKGNATCMKGLRAKDYTTFARGYNGGGQAAAYGQRIQDAADAYTAVTAGKKYAE